MCNKCIPACFAFLFGSVYLNRQTHQHWFSFLGGPKVNIKILKRAVFALKHSNLISNQLKMMDENKMRWKERIFRRWWWGWWGKMNKFNRQIVIWSFRATDRRTNEIRNKQIYERFILFSFSTVYLKFCFASDTQTTTTTTVDWIEKIHTQKV